MFIQLRRLCAEHFNWCPLAQGLVGPLGVVEFEATIEAILKCKTAGLIPRRFPGMLCCSYPEFCQHTNNATSTLNGTPFSRKSLSPLNKHRDVCSSVINLAPHFGVPDIAWPKQIRK